MLILYYHQDPAVADAPMKLEVRVSTPPRFTIKPTGTSVSVNAILNIYLIPADHPPVQLSSMTMVGPNTHLLADHIFYVSIKIGMCCQKTMYVYKWRGLNERLKKRLFKPLPIFWNCKLKVIKWQSTSFILVIYLPMLKDPYFWKPSFSSSYLAVSNKSGCGP